MGSETKQWQNSEIPKLPLLAFSSMKPSDLSGMLSPQIHTSSSASIPFHWEEEPGKPKFSFKTTTISNLNDSSQKKFLELPPRMLLMEPKIPKLLPPINLLEGRPQPCSFHKACCGSFGFEKKQLGAMVLRKRGLIEREFWFGKSSLGSKREVGSGWGSVFPSSSLESENETSTSRIQRRRIFSCLSQAKNEFWGSIYEGLKQINMPWKSKKHEKE